MNVPKLRFKEFDGEWEACKLGSVTNSFSGGTPSVGNSSYYNGDVPFIRSGEINSEKTELFLTEEGLNNSSAKIVEVGDILYALYGATSGEVSISKIHGAINQAILAIKPIKGYSSQFIMQWLKLQKKKVIGKYLQGGQGNLSGSIVKDLLVKFPNFEEQQKNGEFFEKLDKKIQLQQQKINLLQEQKKGFLQKMFPKVGETQPEMRFDGFTGDWEVYKWVDTVDISTNMVDPKNVEYDEFLHIGPGNIESFTGRILDNVNTVKEDNLISGKFHFKAGDIIYGKINPQLAKYTLVDFEGLASADAYILNAKNGINQQYLYTILQGEKFYKYSVSVSMRTGMPKINRDELNQYNYLAPNLKEQQKIGEFFKGLDNKIEVQKRKLQLLQKQKQGFMQQMFI